jgi:CarboxypepD_reg-like domain
MKFYLFLMIVIPKVLFSQVDVRAFVCNSKGYPLSFTNIVSTKKQRGTITNENGEFQISIFASDDTLKITNVAYLSITIPVSDIHNNDTLFLRESIKSLEGVVVKNWNNYKSEVNLGFFNFSNHGEFILIPGSQIATFIANSFQKEGLIKGIYFRLKETGICKNSLRLRLLSLDTLTNEPFLDILNEDIIITNSDLKSKNYIDLTSHHILMPPTGVFIILELLFPENDCEKKSFTTISATLRIDKNLVWLNFRDRKWGYNNRPRLPNGNYMTPNISIKAAS